MLIRRSEFGGGRRTVPALDEGLLHPGGPLGQRWTGRVLTHHGEELQQQLGALGLPSTTLPTKDAQTQRSAKAPPYRHHSPDEQRSSRTVYLQSKSWPDEDALTVVSLPQAAVTFIGHSEDVRRQLPHLVFAVQVHCRGIVQACYLLIWIYCSKNRTYVGLSDTQMTKRVKWPTRNQTGRQRSLWKTKVQLWVGRRIISNSYEKL